MGEIIQWKSRKKAPVCRHEGADSHNIGYGKLTLSDGIPIEAELYRYEDTVMLSVIMPEFDTQHESRYGIRKSQGRGGVVPFIGKSEGYDYAVLDTGMVFVDQEEDVDIVCEYVEYLADMGVMRWTGEERDGFVEYLIDEQGNDLACVKITVEENGQKFCEPLLSFRGF